MERGAAFHPRADRSSLPVRVRRARGSGDSSEEGRRRVAERLKGVLQQEIRSWCLGDWRLVAGRGLDQGSQCVLVYI